MRVSDRRGSRPSAQEEALGQRCRAVTEAQGRALRKLPRCSRNGRSCSGGGGSADCRAVRVCPRRQHGPRGGPESIPWTQEQGPCSVPECTCVRVQGVTPLRHFSKDSSLCRARGRGLRRGAPGPAPSGRPNPALPPLRLSFRGHPEPQARDGHGQASSGPRGARSPRPRSPARSSVKGR